jgi:hypothetical protein
MTPDSDPPASSDPSAFSASGAAGRHRKPPTIELTAREIERAPDAASPAGPAAPAGDAPPSAAAANQLSSDASVTPSVETSGDAPGADSTTQSGPDAPGAAVPPAHDPRSRRIPVPALIGAGIAGGVTAALVLAVVYLAANRGFAPGVRAARLAAVEQQLRELSARPVPATVDPDALEALGARLARLEAAVASPRPAASDPALAARISAVEAEVKAMIERAGALGRSSEEAAAAAREARTRTEANAAALADYAKRLPAAGSDRASRLALAAAALDRAVVRGEPFAAELAAARVLGADADALAALAPFAAGGLPPAGALARELAVLGPTLAQAAGGAPREVGWFDRLAANAEKIVRIRPLAEVAGSDPAAVVARIEVKAAAGDVAAALAELSSLPSAVRAPVEGWIAKAQARAAALAASRRLAADTLAGLGQ